MKIFRLVLLYQITICTNKHYYSPKKNSAIFFRIIQLHPPNSANFALYVLQLAIKNTYLYYVRKKDLKKWKSKSNQKKIFPGIKKAKCIKKWLCVRDSGANMRGKHIVWQLHTRWKKLTCKTILKSSKYD